MDLFAGKKIYPFERCSFLIFAMHCNVSAILTKIIFFVLPKNEIFATVNLFLTIILTVTCIYIFQVILSKKFVHLKKILCGK